ncbi:MAG: ABC transporter substrate-binding protein [Dethiobacter sp.]|jgi:branched-chain amino acid transport system substrate-binding protein|nr:ABC transporter substrate-binding protein [Dethiobacter sp.]
MKRQLRLVVTLIIVVMLVAVSISGCGRAKDPVPTPGEGKVETLKFGIISFLTGPAAPWGIPNSRSINLGAWKVNDQGGFKVGDTTYKWDVVVYDSKYVPAEGVSALNRFIYDDKGKFVAIGGGSVVAASLQLLKENEILSLNFAGGGKMITNPGNPLVFRYNPSIEIMYATFIPYLQKNENIKTMAVINPDDETGQSGAEAARLVADQFGVTIVAEEYFERGTAELSPLLTKVMAANPDLIETSYTDPATSALILKQARELGYKGTILLSWGPDPKQVIQIAGAHAEGAYMALAGPQEPQNSAQQEIYTRFVARWPVGEFDPNIWHLTEVIPALTKAIVETQSFDPNVLAQKLENMEWDSPAGTLAFGGSKVFGIKRQLLWPMTAYQVRGGKPVFVGTWQVPAGILD